jgi:hypothetical protein
VTSGVLVTFTDNLGTLVKGMVCQDHTTKLVVDFAYTNATTNTVTFTPASSQTVDCYVTTGGVGATGPTGPTGPAGGGVTSVATTGPITGGTITTTGTIACATCTTSAAALTSGQLIAGAGSQAEAVTNLTGDVTTSGGVATTIASNAVTTAKINAGAVTSAKQSVEPTRRTFCNVIGANNGSALADADLGPQSRQQFIPFAGTLVEVEVSADAGTPNIIVGRSRAGTIVNVTSSALATAASGGIACSNSGGTTGLDGATTCSSTIQNTSWNVGDWITLVSGTAGGTAKEMTACLTFVTTN